MNKKTLGLIVLTVLGLISCGREAPEPTPRPIEFPTPIPMATPAPTPIPGFVGGEEAFAYTSFVEYYQEEVLDCYWSDGDYDAGVSENYQGTAVYVGDGIWRFHVETYIVYLDDGFQEEEYTYQEEMVEVRSLPDRTWEDVCMSEEEHAAEYYNQLAEEAAEEYEREREYEEWLDSQVPDEEWEEPPEYNPYE